MFVMKALKNSLILVKNKNEIATIGIVGVLKLYFFTIIILFNLRLLIS